MLTRGGAHQIYIVASLIWKVKVTQLIGEKVTILGTMLYTGKRGGLLLPIIISGVN